MFYLACPIGQVAFSCHKKLGIFKFMFSLTDTFFIVHILDSNFVFCGPKLDLRQYNQCCNSYNLFVTSYSYSYITKNITSYRYKLQTPKCN